MNILSKTFSSIFKHKLLTGIVVVLFFIGGYFGYNFLTNKNEGVSYLTAAVEKGTIVVSVSGSGQVAALDQIDIKPKVSGEVVFVNVKNGQEVKAGEIIVYLETRDAQKAMQEAEINLANAKIAVENAKGKAEESLSTAYDDGLNALTNTFKELLPIMPEIKNMFTKSSYSGDTDDIDYYLHLVRNLGSNSEQISWWQGNAEEKYLALEKEFNRTKNLYFALNQSSSYEEIETIINQTYEMVKLFLDFSRQSYNLTRKYQTIIEAENITPPISSTITDEHLSQLAELTSTLINRSDNLFSIKQSLIDKKQALANEGVDIEAKELKVRQCEDALTDARENLAQHYIRAAFDGLVTEVNIKKGDLVSTATTLATLITQQKIAEISLNEVDAAKLKVGQKATLTFDALSDVTLTGKVIEVDTIGTVAQGVVSYGVKIVLDSENEQIKPGMSVTADIIADVKQDVILVSNSAVKSQENIYYVQVMENNTPRFQQVEVGLSNDTMTEIVSGVAEGDIVVVSTISGNETKSQAAQTQSRERFNMPIMNGGGMPSR